MPLKTEAIVARSPMDGKRKWAIEEVEVPDIESVDILVEVIACGICHTDLGCGSFPDGEAPFPLSPYPRVLGHEGAGYVKAIGKDVDKVKVGDPVLLSFACCGECHNCRFGAPGYCRGFVELNFFGNLRGFNSAHGHVGGGFFGQSSFSRLVRAQATSVVNVAGLVNDEKELKLFAPLGCGIQTGAGTITNIGAAGEQDTVAVIGLGGVGLSAIMAAKVRQCRKIIAIDRIASRLEFARDIGATDTVDTANLSGTLIETILEITSGVGTTITMDATGVETLIQQGLQFTAREGKMILVGVAGADAVLSIPIVSYMVSGKKLLGSMEGGVKPSEYIPQMIEWYRSGEFPIDKLIKQYQFHDFEVAIREMEEGTTIKPVLIW